MGSKPSKGVVVRKQRVETITLIQLGLFLSATLATIIGGAWTNVLQSNFLNTVSNKPSTGIPPVLAAAVFGNTNTSTNNTSTSTSVQPVAPPSSSFTSTTTAFASTISPAWYSSAPSSYTVTAMPPSQPAPAKNEQQQHNMALLSAFATHEQQQFSRYQTTVKNAKKSNLWYAIWVTVAGVLIMVVWTLFLQELNPSLVSSTLPVPATKTPVAAPTVNPSCSIKCGK